MSHSSPPPLSSSSEPVSADSVDRSGARPAENLWNENPMTPITSDQETPETYKCPYLGIPDDATTHYTYPSRLNFCHMPERPSPIQFDHQQAFCLGIRHSECPVYRVQGLTTLPPSIRGIDPTPPSFWSRNAFAALVGILILALVSLLLFVILPQPNSDSAATFLSPTPLKFTETPEPSPTPVPAFGLSPKTPTPSPTQTHTPTVTLSPTATDTPTSTFTPTYFPSPGPGFGTPFGANPAFAIHMVKAGESFTGIAALYKTTSEVLAAINPVNQGQTLWVDRPIVVAVGVTDLTGLPQFNVYQTEVEITLDALATQFGVDPELIRLYNVLSDTIPEIPAGRWLIIPLP
ncbi:MAG TPA: LysM peptidoglycan-binding domain-containing protein [Anaerolineales bacterium]|nr:LysM peptidoglycan-binding domain-containing protein [Anaerolineales bacterium]